MLYTLVCLAIYYKEGVAKAKKHFFLLNQGKRNKNKEGLVSFIKINLTNKPLNKPCL